MKMATIAIGFVAGLLVGNAAHAEALQQVPVVTQRDAALTKAIEVIRAALGLKTRSPFGIGKTTQTVINLKSCLKVPDADTKQVYYGAAQKGKITYLILVRGEKSGTAVLFGTDCGAVVAASPLVDRL